MTLLVSLSMLVLAILSHRIARSWFFPPALYALYWSIIILASTVLTFGNHTLTVESLLVFAIGCIVFSISGYVALLRFGYSKPKVQVTQRRKEFIQTCIVLYSFGLFTLAFFFFKNIQEIGYSLGISNFGVAARFALSTSDRLGIARYFLSLTSVGGILAYYAAWLYEGKRRDKITLVLSVLAPLLMSVLTFSRSPVYALTIGVLAIMVFRKTVRLQTILVSIVLVLALTLTMNIWSSKGQEFEAGESMVGWIVKNIAIYFVGGPLAFSEIMESPPSVGGRGLSLMFFTQAAQSFGADMQLPNPILDYVNPDLGNVYTIYYAYWLDWGWWGIVGMAFCAGLVCTTVYMLARRGNPIAGAAMGRMIGSIFSSAWGDGIFGSSIPWLLVILIGGLLWRIPVRKEKL